MTLLSNMSKWKDSEVLQERVNKLEDKVGKLESNLDEVSEHDRRDTLVFSKQTKKFSRNNHTRILVQAFLKAHMCFLGKNN